VDANGFAVSGALCARSTPGRVPRQQGIVLITFLTLILLVSAAVVGTRGKRKVGSRNAYAECPVGCQFSLAPGERLSLRGNSVRLPQRRPIATSGIRAAT